MNEKSGDAPPDSAGAYGAPAELRHDTTVADDGSVECTIFPRDCDGDEFVTHWITAKGGSFVSLPDLR
jgi:hypothetical protein